MKTKSLTPMGSMHPVLFFVLIYLVALIVSIFICSSLFYSCNAHPVQKLGKQDIIKERTSGHTGATALRE